MKHSMKRLAVTVVLTTLLSPISAYAADDTKPVGEIGGAAVSANGSSFADLNQVSQDKQQAIAEAVRQGLISGDGNGNFRPADTLTRQELAVLLAKALQLNVGEANGSSFSDVGSEAWGLRYIQAVQQAGLMTGDANGAFRPNDHVSREEMATVFVRAVNGQGTRGGKTVAVNDLNLSSSWASDSVSTALRLGLVNPLNGDSFNPQGNVQRQDIVPYLLGIFQSSEQQATITSVEGDVVTIDGQPYLITGALKKLIGEGNQAALQGAKLKFKSKNRSLNELEDVEIVQGGTDGQPLVLDVSGTELAGALHISGDHVMIKGDASTKLGQVVLQNNAGHVQLDAAAAKLVISTGQPVSLTGSGSVSELSLSDSKSRLSLANGMHVGTLTLPGDARASDVIANYDAARGQFGNVTGGLPEQLPTPTPTPRPSSNHAPQVTNPISGMTLTVGNEGVQIPLNGVFTDQDDDVLTYKVESLDPTIASVQLIDMPPFPFPFPVPFPPVPPINPPVPPINPQVTELREAPSTAKFMPSFGPALSINPLKEGKATIRVTASDNKGGKRSFTFEVTVQAPVVVRNQPPVLDSPLPDQTLPLTTGPDASKLDLDLAGYFYDPDDDAMTLEASSSNPAIVTTSVSGMVVTLTGVNADPAPVTITIIVNDTNDHSVSTTFTVTVNAPEPAPTPQPPVAPGT